MLGIILISFHSLTIAFHSTQFFGTTKWSGYTATDSNSALQLLRVSCLFAAAFCSNMHWRGETFLKNVAHQLAGIILIVLVHTSSFIHSCSVI